MESLVWEPAERPPPPQSITDRGELVKFLKGKSADIRKMVVQLTVTAGGGHVGGANILTESEKIKKSIGYMSQKFSLYDDLTVKENIDFYSGIYKIPVKEKKERFEEISSILLLLLLFY